MFKDTSNGQTHSCTHTKDDSLCRDCLEILQTIKNEASLDEAVASAELGINYNPHQCPYCKQPLKPVYDEISEKMSEWTFECSCPDWPKGVVISIG